METYTVTRTVRETPDVTTIYLLDATGTHADFRPGQYVTVQFPDLAAQVPAGKAYSIASIPSDAELAISVKAIGRYSNRLCSLQPGDTVQLSKPYGYLYAESERPLVCIGAGVGMSPLMSIVRSELMRRADRAVTVLCSNKTAEDIVYFDVLHELDRTHIGLRVTHYITRAPQPHGAHYRSGRIQLQAQPLPDKAFYAVCGSVAFVAAMYQQLKALGVVDARIATETFFES